MKRFMTVIAGLAISSAAAGQIVHDYENYDEGFLGETFSADGLTYRDANRVSGFYPDGTPFDDDDNGNKFIIEDATALYNDFPGYGSADKALTFGSAFVPGDNLTIGALASAWIDLDTPATDVTLDIAYYENGPWGGIEYVLEAFSGGNPVARDSFVISDLGGRDNPAWRSMSISGAEFDSLHLYGWLNNDYTAPRGIIDDVSITLVPEPATLGLLLLGAAALRRSP